MLVGRQQKFLRLVLIPITNKLYWFLTPLTLHIPLLHFVKFKNPYEPDQAYQSYCPDCPFPYRRGFGRSRYVQCVESVVIRREAEQRVADPPHVEQQAQGRNYVHPEVKAVEVAFLTYPWEKYLHQKINKSYGRKNSEIYISVDVKKYESHVFAEQRVQSEKDGDNNVLFGVHLFLQRFLEGSVEVGESDDVGIGEREAGRRGRSAECWECGRLHYLN